MRAKASFGREKERVALSGKLLGKSLPCWELLNSFIKDETDSNLEHPTRGVGRGWLSLLKVLTEWLLQKTLPES